MIVAITRICRLHRGQRSTANPNVLFIIITAHSRRLAPPAPQTAAAPAPSLSLEYYAAMCAELSIDPRRAAEIYPRYGLRDAAAWRTADGEWQARLRVDAASQARWQQLVAHYRAYYGKR